MKKFIRAELDVDCEIFMMHVVALNIEGTNIAIYSFLGAQLRWLKANKTPTTVFAEYSN